MVKGTLPPSVLVDHAGATTMPPMTRAAGGAVARHSDHGLSFREPNIPVLSEFRNASTKPHIHAVQMVTFFANEFLLEVHTSWPNYNSHPVELAISSSSSDVRGHVNMIACFSRRHLQGWNWICSLYMGP